MLYKCPDSKQLLFLIFAAQPLLVMPALSAKPDTSALTATTDSGRTGALKLRVAQRVETFSVANAVVRSGEKIPLKVTISVGLNPDTAFVMFLGIPADFKLSAGVRTKNSWAVSLRDLKDLYLISPPGYEGVMEIDVVLVRGKDAPMDRQTIIALVKPDSATDKIARSDTAPANPRSPETEAASSPLPRLSVEMTAEYTLLLQRGDELLATGDIAAARLLFTRLAKNGVAMGALRMARTYDPEFLNSIQTAGLQPDIQQARVWYQKASELGNQDATKRLSTLSIGEPQR